MKRASGGLGAYMSIFNDWDILPAALSSIAPYVDELVVVDGAYGWMTPFLAGIGEDPSRSADVVYDRLAEAGIPCRVISGVWGSEWEKRQAGYAACRCRYRLRIDADEVFFFDPGRLDAFFASNAPAAMAEIPLYAAPGWITAGHDTPEAVLFDAARISAEDHLKYLRLLDRYPRPAGGPPAPYPEAVAFAAHLTLWRTPPTGVNRAAFYTLDHIRKHGAPWFPELASRPVDDLAQFFCRIPGPAYRDSLHSHEIAIGYLRMAAGLLLAPTPLTAGEEQQFAPLFERFLESQASENAKIAQSGRYTLGPASIDMTRAAAASAIADGGRIVLESPEPLIAAEARLHYLIAAPPWEIHEPLETDVAGGRLTIALPAADSEPAFLRKVLTFAAWAADGNPLVRLTRR